MMPLPPKCDELNDAQRAALDLDRDLLVDAGAGTGKTQVLALRVLALIELGRAAISEIVAFTFTEKAAAEMRGRVQQLLLARIAQLQPLARRDHEAAERVERLKRASAEFNLARVSTVHGFCHRLLAEHAWEAGLEPGAPMLDEREQALARSQAIARVLTRTRQEDAPEAAAALERLGAISRLNSLSDSLERMLARREEFLPALEAAAASWADPAAEIARRREAWARQVAQAIQPCLAALEELPLDALKVVATDDKLRQSIVEIRDAARACPKPEAVETLRTCLLQASGAPRSFARQGNAKKWANGGNALEVAQAVLAKAAQALGEHGEVLEFRFDEAHERRCGKACIDLLAVMRQVLAVYEEECAGALDFLELELRTLKLLRENPALAAEVGKRIRYLLIDEFQDTNPTQSKLFSLLADTAKTPGRLFAVGDAKQSIYGFRGSDVGVFNDARQSIPARNDALADKSAVLPWELACENTAARRRGLISLDTNYRSDRRLLEAGNVLLGALLKRDSYRRFDAQPQSMRAGKSETDVIAPAEMHLLMESNKDDEPELVAERVLALQREGVKLCDIAILARRRAFNSAVAQALARRRIPFAAQDEGGLLQTQEALDCLNLLRALSSASDDIAWLGLMRSPLCGLSDNALMQLAPDRAQEFKPLSARLAELAPENAHDKAALERFRAVLGALTPLVGRQTPAALLSRALAQCGAAMAVSCGAAAEQRAANLRRMVEVVRETQERFPSLAALVRELMRRADAGEEEAQGEPEQQGDFVRLMTIHGAKGLEFPVVIVPEIGNTRGANETSIVREAPRDGSMLGLHLPWLADGPGRGELAPDFEAWRAAALAKDRACAEYRRLFYVAFTRAKNRLILTGSVKDEIKTGERASWAEDMLGALGCGGFGGALTRNVEGLALHWHRDASSQARALPQNAALVDAALASGEIPLPRPINASLVAPLATSAAAYSDPRSLELGVLVHAELERRILARARGRRVASRDDEVGKHADRAEAALLTLRKAREIPEYRIFGESAERRIDLLRHGDGEFEIIDYKTDAIEAGLLQRHARERHGEQLRQYAAMLRNQLKAHGASAKRIRLLVCFTAPDVKPEQRLVEIEDKP